MGNNNSAPSQTHYGSQGTNVASTEPHYVAPNPRKLHSMSQGANPPEQHGKKPLRNDEAFTTYIKDAKYKMESSKSKIGGHEEQSNHIPVDVTNETSKENEKDHFSNFIQNARKKLRTVTRRNSSIRRG